MVTLPPDSHVHSQWSWDAPVGDMERSCQRAQQLGLPAIAFTEHLDHTVWRVPLDSPHVKDHLASVAGPDGILTPPPFDAAGYLEAIERCRDRFPGLRVLSGLEMGEPLAVTFGSDAHLPPSVGHGFAQAAHLAQAHGFRPGKHPYDLWGRVS